MKNYFDDCLELIKSPKIRVFTKEVLKAAPKEFWTAPASSSKKHHPAESNVDGDNLNPGGLVIHTRKMIQEAIFLFEFFGVKDQLIKDKILSACHLHDSCKSGCAWGKDTISNHGPIAADWLEDVILITLCLNPSPRIAKIWNQEGIEPQFDQDLKDIIELIRNHMGIWNSPIPTPALTVGKKLKEKDVWHLIVQLADYESSQKIHSYKCDTIITDKKEGK